MKFYIFQQNNSGGCFVVNKDLCGMLLIEATTYDEARDKALSLGVYFNGVEEEIDCDCCGDRWDDFDREIETPIEVAAFIYTDLIPNYKLEWHNKYGKYLRKEEPKIFKNKFGDKYGTGCIFNTVEEYAQYLADEYHWTTPDVRIFYNSGEVKEIFAKGK